MGEIEPPVPPEPPQPKGGTPRVPDRAALTGIIFVLKCGILWEMLPKEMRIELDLPPGAARARHQGPHRQEGQGDQRKVGAASSGGGKDARVACATAGFRYERRADIHKAFLDLGCSLICSNHLS